MALVGILAALAGAGGMRFPEVKEAAAQGVVSGYSYTQRVCQEYGQQPRHYQVRDPIPGSDWRSDGGWAIVLIRGATVRPAQYVFGAPSKEGGASTRIAALGTANSFMTGTALRAYGLRTKDYIIATNGLRGFVLNFGRDVVVDRNGDRQITTADMITGVQHPWNLWGFERRQYTRTVVAANYGTQYIRWANMMWCR